MRFRTKFQENNEKKKETLYIRSVYIVSLEKFFLH